jgi:hypothetical protein
VQPERGLGQVRGVTEAKKIQDKSDSWRFPQKYHFYESNEDRMANFNCAKAGKQTHFFLNA